MPTSADITRHDDSDPSENPWVNGPPPPETIAIVAYKSEWPHRYQTAAAQIRAALGQVVLDVEHVGSTSVPGLAAKDVIDIDLTVADLRHEQSYVPPLARIGYTLTAREPSWHEHRCLRLAEPRVNCTCSDQPAQNSSGLTPIRWSSSSESLDAPDVGRKARWSW